MLIRTIISISVLSALAQAQTTCPSRCSCSLDIKGRKQVTCNSGGLTGPLHVVISNMSLDTEILKISAPEDNSNNLAMSPVFQSYPNLEEIWITKSNIPQLGQYFFWKQKKLDVLNLSQNNITQPLDHNFKGLDHLRELNLDDNKIQSLPSGTFRYLHELKVLSIQRNRIKELSNRIFMEIGKLRILKLSGNNLKELHPEVFDDAKELRELDCRGCALQSVHGDIYELLPHLTHLDLGDNEIKSITNDDLQFLTNLRHLRLDGNHLTAIYDGTFINQQALKKLNLARNQINKISPNAFADLTNLTELDLAYNKLEKFHGIFEPIASNLQTLILSGNHLKLSLIKEISYIQSLRELRLSNCGLYEIDDLIFPPGLETLDLSQNRISRIHSAFLPFNLKELDLAKNSLRGIDENDLQKLDRYKNLNLQHNPWSCDLCFIVPLLERINRSAAYSDIICMSPITNRGKKLGMLQKEELTWCSPGSTEEEAEYFLVGGDKRIGIVAASMFVSFLFLTIVAVIGAICYSRRHAANYYTHEDKLAAMEGENIFENNQSPLFCDGELSFKFPLDHEKKMSISTIEDIKKEHKILANGT